MVTIHSTSDVITNSSEVIFTFENGAKEVLIEIIKEFSKLFGTNLRWDEMFDLKEISQFKLEKTPDYIVEQMEETDPAISLY